jgi:hypothetical protein
MSDTLTADCKQVIGDSGHQQPDNQHSYVSLSYLSLANGCNVRTPAARMTAFENW